MSVDSPDLQAALTAAVARNVREARTDRSWTLDQLAARSGVSKGMVVQIEGGKTNPSIGTLSKLAEALGVALASLIEIEAGTAVRVIHPSRAVTLWEGLPGSRAVLLVGGRRPDVVELWEWHLAPGDAYDGRRHAPGVRELLTVRSGMLRLIVDDEVHELGPGGSASYDGDRAHRYENAGDGPLVFTLVMVDPAGSRHGEARIIPEP